jgi:hypothetical protein
MVSHPVVLRWIEARLMLTQQQQESEFQARRVLVLEFLVPPVRLSGLTMVVDVCSNDCIVER